MDIASVAYKNETTKLICERQDSTLIQPTSVIDAEIQVEIKFAQVFKKFADVPKIFNGESTSILGQFLDRNESRSH